MRSPTPLCTTVPSCDQVIAALPRKVPTPCTSMSTSWLGPGVSGETVYCRGSATACACATPAASKSAISAMLRSFCIGFIADQRAHRAARGGKVDFVLRGAHCCHTGIHSQCRRRRDGPDDLVAIGRSFAHVADVREDDQSGPDRQKIKPRHPLPDKGHRGAFLVEHSLPTEQEY